MLRMVLYVAETEIDTMTQSNALERLDELIGRGEAVIRAKVASRSVIALVEPEKFGKWRINSLTYLQSEFGDSSIHFKEFEAKCNAAIRSEAVDGLAVLRAAKFENLSGFRPSESRTLNVDSLPLHPRIAAVCLNLYRDGHYPNAVYDASKALNNLVKERSGRHDMDGASLMRTVFSRNSPVLAFSELVDQSDLDEQEGMMHLYEGVALGIRNPRGHEFPEDTPERAFEYICLISLLANRLDETHRTGN